MTESLETQVPAHMLLEQLEAVLIRNEPQNIGTDDILMLLGLQNTEIPDGLSLYRRMLGDSPGFFNEAGDRLVRKCLFGFVRLLRDPEMKSDAIRNSPKGLPLSPKGQLLDSFGHVVINQLRKAGPDPCYHTMQYGLRIRKIWPNYFPSDINTYLDDELAVMTLTSRRGLLQ